MVFYEKEETMNVKLFSIIIIIIYSQSIFAYVHNQTISGINVHWPASVNVVDVYVNSQNATGLPEADVQAIADSSINQWNGTSRLSLRKNTTTGKNQINLNEIYFSNDPVFFGGTGVKGVTQVSYKQDTGEIFEADILIDDSLNAFSKIVTDINFLGNVFTHEIGHLLGLGHGQVLGSTMFYEMSLGQSQLSADDKAASFSTYPLSTLARKSISGLIIGSKSLIPVFGTQVEAVSLKTGQVAAAGVTDPSGKFIIDGLESGDQYFLYTKPLVPIGLPANYANIKSNFCETSKSYRGSFFERCGASGEGYPQSISLNNSNVDVGKISIRCGLDVPPGYMQQKGQAGSIFNLITGLELNGSLGNTFVGFFSANELILNTPDQFNVNLSSVSPAEWQSFEDPQFNTAPISSLYLEIKVINQIFISPYNFDVIIRRPSLINDIVPIAVNGNDGFLNLDLIAHVPIDRVNLSENNFTIQVIPRNNLKNNSTYFPSILEFKDQMNFYMAAVTLVKSNNGGLTFTPVSAKTYQISDNASCPDAFNTYSLTSFNGQVTNTVKNNQKKTLACGSIDINNNNGDGPKGFLVGLTLCYIFVISRSRFIKRL